MATITSVTDGGSYHWNDTAAWQGGVVPTGSGDIAQIRHTFTLINSGSGYPYWEGVRNHITVDSTSGFASTSGSFYSWLTPGMTRVQILYDSISGNNFQFCTISQSYSPWTGGRAGITESGSYVGFIEHDAPVFTKPTQIYLSGSSEWHIGRIIVQDQAEFIIKDDASLRLDSTTYDSYIECEDAVVEILDRVTCSLAGTTERNSSLFHSDTLNFGSIKVSGSSDLRTRTSVNGDHVESIGTLNVDNSSDFEIGDFISVYTEDDTEVVMTKDANYDYPAEYYRYHSSGSIFPTAKRAIKRRDGKILNENETFEVLGKANGKLYVGSMFEAEGTVFATNQKSRDEFLRDLGNVKNFTGNKTEIRVRSEHNSFKEGEFITTEAGLSARILKVKDILVPYKTVNFANGDSLHDNFYIDEFMGSGSSGQYKLNSSLDMVSGSFGLTISGSTYGTNNWRKNFLLKNTRLRDYRLTISASMRRPHDNDYNSDRDVVAIGRRDPHQVHRDRDHYGGHGYDRYIFTGIRGDDLRCGNYPWGYNQSDTDNINNEARVTGVNSSTVAGGFTLMQDCLRERETHYFNGVESATTLKDSVAGGVGFHLRRENSIVHSMIVDEYVQQLVLDTSTAIPVGTKIRKGASAVKHYDGQKVVKIATKVKDRRGYAPLLGEYYYTGSTGTGYPNMPDVAIPHIFDNNGDKTLYVTSDTTDRRNCFMFLFNKHNRDDAYFRIASDSAQSYVTLNLGKSLTFDAFSIGFYYDTGGGTTANDIRIDISNDGTNFTTVRSAAGDTRRSYIRSAIRYFDLDSAQTARFVRLYISGTSQSGNNYLNHFNLHRFNGRGKSIEVCNASDLNVGDFIYFSNPRVESYSDYVVYRNSGGRSRAQAGTDTETNSIGGVYNYFTITAKSGNVITVNKDFPKPMWEDTFVTKLNRSITVKSETFVPFGLHYGSSVDEQRSYEFRNVATLHCGGNSRERNYWYIRPDAGQLLLDNCSFNFIEPAEMYNPSAAMNWRNCLTIGQSRQETFTAAYETSDCIVHGNIRDGGDYTRIYPAPGQTQILSGNILLGNRYNWFEQHSGQDRGGLGKVIVRQNFFRAHDYVAMYFGYNHSETLMDNFEFSNNKISNPNQSGIYLRMFPESRQRGQHTRQPFNNIMEYYPKVAQTLNGYNARTLSNIQPYEAVGRDNHRLQVFYDNPAVHGKSYMTDDGRVMIMPNEQNPNIFELFTIHNNRNAARLFTSNFKVYTDQEIRVQVKMTFVNDIGTVLDNRSTAHSEQIMLIFDDQHRSVPGTREVVPFRSSMGEYTYDKTFTVPAGNYQVIFLCRRDGHYNMKHMDFSKMSCQITGATPTDIHISHNGFNEYLQLVDRTKAIGGHQTIEGQEAIKNQPTKNVVRFRKIRF